MSSFRIPKKAKVEGGGDTPAGQQSSSSSSSSQPPMRVTLPTSSTGSSNGKTFQPIGSCPVQTNLFKVDISRMPNSFTRLSIETHLCGGKNKIKLSDGLVSVSGGLNSTDRRLALRVIFRKLVQKHPEIFGNDILRYAYDCATTIYAVEGAYKGRNDTIEERFEKKDFSDDEWSQICRILRKQSLFFEVKLSSNGIIYSKGQKSMTDHNRQELTRLVEIVSSEVLNTPDFLHYGSQTFPLRDAAVQKPDATTEIRSGFDKGVRLLEGTGTPEIVMSIDTKQSAFHSSMHVLKFITSKYAEFKGIPAARGPRRDRGDRRDRRSRSRSPIQRNQEYNPDEVKEIEHIWRNGDRSLMEKIQEAIKGLFAEPIHLEGNQNRNFVVHRFSEKNAKDTYFELDTGKATQRQISVFQYFEDTYKIRLKYPYLPLIVSGRLRNSSYFPMELLRIVAGQRLTQQKATPAVQSSMTGQNATLPLQHIQRIQEIMKGSLKLTGNPHLAMFGVQVARDPIKLSATMICPAQITFANRSVCQLNPGSVQFRQKPGSKYVRAARLVKVAVVGFDGVEVDLNQFCQRLHSICQRNQLQLDSAPDSWPRLQLNSNDIRGISSNMEKLKGITILIGITPEKKPDVHDTLKYFEASLGLQTLQIHFDTADRIIKDQGGSQTVDNVMRKLNLKCGGINFLVEGPQNFAGKAVCPNIAHINQKLFAKTQFVGFEMSHGSARTLYDRSQGLFDGEPTIVGCSYSLKLATELGGFNFVQEMNEHKLKNLDKHFTTCLDTYKSTVGHLPETIVVYRTGAGEGDYTRVQEEVTDMKKAIDSLKGPKPKLVVIVVQKTSHTRIFPAEIRGRKAVEQNVKSGTVIEGQITSFGRQEFILVSQTALIGTVRPIKFTVVANEAGWSKNEIIHLSYFLAFGHQVSYQPPAVPHVLYAAENLAKRGRNNFLTHKKLGHLNQAVRQVLEQYKDLDAAVDLDSVLVDNITESLNKMAIKNKNFWA